MTVSQHPVSPRADSIPDEDPSAGMMARVISLFRSE